MLCVACGNPNEEEIVMILDEEQVEGICINCYAAHDAHFEYDYSDPIGWCEDF